MLKRYGITFTEYKALLIKQRYRCAACRTDEPGGRGRFHVDHDHETGEVRGLLCTNCNLALGLLKDDVHRVRRLLRYLKR